MVLCIHPGMAATDDPTPDRPTPMAELFDDPWYTTTTSKYTTPLPFLASNPPLDRTSPGSSAMLATMNELGSHAIVGARSERSSVVAAPRGWRGRRARSAAVNSIGTECRAACSGPPFHPVIFFFFFLRKKHQKEKQTISM